MRSEISLITPANENDWQSLPLRLNGGRGNPLLQSLFAQVCGAGAVAVIVETPYFDRDFSAAYSAFYASLFRPMQKHCRRVHFFSCDLSDLAASESPDQQVEVLERAADYYLGNIVLRPLGHAPISNAHLSFKALTHHPKHEIGVRSKFCFHLLGVELEVEAMPLTQQDTRTGACAQATMWMSGRHFQNRHGAPWYSLPAITSVALNPADNIITRSLPAGSDFLTADNMVRALRAMGRQPIMYAPAAIDGQPAWAVNPHEVVHRYVDSGIPVIVGLQRGNEPVGHAVVAVGAERFENENGAELGHAQTPADYLSHFLINDDQRGAYIRLPIHQDDGGDYPFIFNRDVRYLMVPLPAKVYMAAEVAETLARDIAQQLANQRTALSSRALGPDSTWAAPQELYGAIEAGTTICRTYLTYGWKYKARALRNRTSGRLKRELFRTDFPKYVWVTEFGRPEDWSADDPCGRTIFGHVVVDATGSQFWDSVLVADFPGLSVFWHYETNASQMGPTYTVLCDDDAEPYYAKMRGHLTFDACEAERE